MDDLSSAASNSSGSGGKSPEVHLESPAAPIPATTPERRIRIGGHIPKLDSLRGAAILLVLTYHAYGGSVDYRTWHGLSRFLVYLSRYGYTGVELFFVLSGFLITNILLAGKHKPNYYLEFYRRRALRILPAYLAVLLVIKLGIGVTWKYIVACLLYIANMAGLVGARSSEYAPLWSLAVEEQFYLLWPFCVRRIEARSLLKLALGVCFAMPLLRLLAAAVSASIDIRYKTYFIADYLLYGAILAIALNLNIIHKRNIAAVAIGLLGTGSILTLGVVYLKYFSNHTWWIVLLLRAWGVLPFVWIYSGLILRAVQSYNYKNDSSSNSVLAFFGYISYGLYLIHEFLFREYGRLASGTPLAGLQGNLSMVTLRYLIVGGISVFLAYLSRRFYEDYFLRRGRTRYGMPSNAP
ncbi:MAG TPA: acyltransferase [Acidobacteriaceae bacterium]|nr:acyltransferase [Acidobacteriaceae bacterium]